MLKRFLRWLFGIVSPSRVWSSPAVRQAMRDGLADGLAGERRAE